MAATLRELRGRIRSAGSIKKITKAQELIATSRISKAQARVQAARPYADEITNMLTNLAGASALDHPLLVERGKSQACSGFGGVVGPRSGRRLQRQRASAGRGTVRAPP
jgi:ATP synthase F1 gamma subunit